MNILVDPRSLLPTISPCELDLKLVESLRFGDPNKLISEDHPIVCFETNGYFVITDGHHRWSAALLSASPADVYVKIVPPEKITSLNQNDLMAEVNWHVIYEWEDMLKTRLMGPEFQPIRHGGLNTISGPSGVGKTRILQHISASANLLEARTTTTRQPRNQEVNGKDYDFVSEAQFSKMLEQNSFVEWQFIHGDYYGSRWDYMFTNRDPKSLVVRDLDTFGALQLKALYPNYVHTVFVDAPSFDDISSRIKNRKTESHARQLVRLTSARRELSFSAFFDALVVNDSSIQAAESIRRLCETRKASSEPALFFEDSTFYGHYVCLEVEVETGNYLNWSNLNYKIPPILLLNTATSVEVGYQSLENMLVEQLANECRDNGSDRHILRDFVQSLGKDVDRYEIIGGASGCVKISVKKITATAIASYVSSQSRFFSIGKSIRSFLGVL